MADLSGDVPVWNPTSRQRVIVAAALKGASASGIARTTGSSVQYVRRVLKEFKLQGNL